MMFNVDKLGIKYLFDGRIREVKDNKVRVSPISSKELATYYGWWYWQSGKKVGVPHGRFILPTKKWRSIDDE